MRGSMADLEMILRMSLFTSFISAFVKSAGKLKKTNNLFLISKLEWI